MIELATTEGFKNYVIVNNNIKYGSDFYYKSHGWKTFFIRIYMPDEKEKWYITDAKNPRFADDIAELLKQTHGDKAHYYALERVVSDTSSEEEVKLWKAVLTLLDKEK